MLGKLVRGLAGRLGGSTRAGERARALNARGLELHRNGALDQAARTFEAAIRADAELPHPRVNLGNVFHDRGDLPRAIACYEAAIGIDPGFAIAHYARGTALLGLGRFEEGWPEYEWRLALDGARPAHAASFPMPRWDGSRALAGKRILLHTEQGFGDAIHFARYAPQVAALGADVLVGCPRELETLFRTLDGVAVLRSGEPLPDLHYHAPLMSVPFALRETHVTAAVPYVGADVRKTAYWAARVRAAANGRPAIGIAWSGNPAHVRARERSLPVADLIEFVAMREFAFVNVQKGAPPGDLAAVRAAGATLFDWSDEFHDFAETAACVAALDAVVSVDTAVAHLTGALGKPLLLMIASIPDWRWGLATTGTPWYPTAHLLRQQHPGSWSEVLAQARTALQRLR
jgi:hypothetical protein